MVLNFHQLELKNILKGFIYGNILAPVIFFFDFDISEPPFIIIACCPGPYSFVVSTNLMLFEGYMCVP